MPYLFKISVAATVLVTSFFSSQTAQAATVELLHRYTFENGVTDSVGNANGALFNGASINNGQLSLDGVNDYVEFNQKLVPFTGSYSVALFAQQNSRQGSFVELISQGFTQGPGFYIGHAPNQGIRVTDSWQNTGIQFPSDGLLHHYAVVVDSSVGQTRFYLDGIIRSVFQSSISTTPFGTNTRFGRQFDNPGNEYFFGFIDDVRIYRGALNGDQVLALTTPEPVDLPPTEPIPTPALLPGLLGMGTATLRKRKQEIELDV